MNANNPLKDATTDSAKHLPKQDTNDLLDNLTDNSVANSTAITDSNTVAMANAVASFQPEPFNPPIWLRSPHLQTIIPKFVVRSAPKYRRELHKDSLGTSKVAYDFYDCKNESFGTFKRTQTPLVVLFHGLEGSSESHYAINLAHQIHAAGWHFVVPHYRSCGGMKVDGDVFYNAGDTAEVEHVLTNLREKYAVIYAVGVSLGGNILAKYLGEAKDSALCQKAMVVSAPLDLTSAAIAMQQGLAKYIYTPYLLNPLAEKSLKTKLSAEERNAVETSKDIYDFDHAFTAPRHGFRSVNEYYYQSASLPLLKHICKPTLIITAKDDPFLGITATKEDVSSMVQFIKTEYGGHIGFLDFQHSADTKIELPEVAQSRFKQSFLRTFHKRLPIDLMSKVSTTLKNTSATDVSSKPSSSSTTDSMDESSENSSTNFSSNSSARSSIDALGSSAANSVLNSSIDSSINSIGNMTSNLTTNVLNNLPKRLRNRIDNELSGEFKLTWVADTAVSFFKHPVD